MTHIVQQNIKQAPSLTDTQSCLTFFQNQLLHQLRYWGHHEALKTNQLTVLDRRRESILTVITLGLDLPSAWPLVRALMLAFTRYMERRGYWHIWNKLLNRAIAMANHLGDTHGSVVISALLARLYLRQGPPNKTVYYHRQAIRLARQAGNRYEEARGLTNLGYFYIDQGYWWRSEILCYSAMTIIDELEDDYLRAVTENHLGILFLRRNEWKRAENRFKSACHIWENIPDNRGNLLFGYMNLGVLFNMQTSPNAAIPWHKKALEQATLQGDDIQKAHIISNLAVAYRHKRDFKQAETLFKEIEDIHHKQDDRLRLARVWGNLGVLYCQQCLWKQAWDYTTAALEGYQTLNNQEGELECLFDLLNYGIAVEDISLVSAYITQIEVRIVQYSQGAYRANLVKRLTPYRRHLADFGTNVIDEDL